MPSVEHVEKHFMATAAVRDIVIGMADGLTVPFALAAGLTSAAAALAQGTGIIVTAGFAEIALSLWLIVVGVNVTRWRARAGAAG